MAGVVNCFRRQSCPKPPTLASGAGRDMDERQSVSHRSTLAFIIILLIVYALVNNEGASLSHVGPTFNWYYENSQDRVGEYGLY